jgi:hypothetical protein
MSAPASASASRSRELSADVRPTRIRAGAQTAVAEVHLGRRQVRRQRLRVGVGREEVDAGEPGANHRVDRIAAAAAHTDDLDARAEIRFVLELDHLSTPPRPAHCNSLLRISLHVR